MSHESADNQNFNDPRISVVVVSYNFEAYLAVCLDSILAQTLMPYEIVVVDDCSTDGSWQVIEAYAARYPEFIVARRQAHNRGQIATGAAARNMVRGELFSVIDGDDYWLPNKLAEEWRALCATPTARAAYCNVFGVDDAGGHTTDWADAGTSPPSGDVFVGVISRQFFTRTQSCYRNELNYSDAVRAIGGLEETESIHADWDLKIRLSARYPVVYTGAKSVAYRTHGANMNAMTTAEDRVASMRAVFAANRRLLDGRSAEERRFVDEQLARLA